MRRRPTKAQAMSGADPAPARDPVADRIAQARAFGNVIDDEALRVLEQMMRREVENAEIAMAIETGQMPIIEDGA